MKIYYNGKYYSNNFKNSFAVKNNAQYDVLPTVDLTGIGNFLAQNYPITGASNLGSFGIFKSISGKTLQFKAIHPGNNITIVSTATGLTINSTGGSGTGSTDNLSFANGLNRIGNNVSFGGIISGGTSINYSDSQITFSAEDSSASSALSFSLDSTLFGEHQQLNFDALAGLYQRVYNLDSDSNSQITLNSGGIVMSTGLNSVPSGVTMTVNEGGMQMSFNINDDTSTYFIGNGFDFTYTTGTTVLGRWEMNNNGAVVGVGNNFLSVNKGDSEGTTIQGRLQLAPGIVTGHTQINFQPLTYNNVHQATGDIWNYKNKMFIRMTGGTEYFVTSSGYTMFTGTTAPSTYATKAKLNLYTGTTAPGLFATKTNFNTFTGTTAPTTYANKTKYFAYTATTAPATFQSKSSVVTLTGTTLPATYQLLNLALITLTGATTLSATHAGKIVQANGTFTITLPNGMTNGMQTTVVNIGTGVITMAATTTLNTKLGSKKLATQYGAGNFYHQGSNIWIGFGDLTA